MRAALIYNPASGRNHAHRKRLVYGVVEELRSIGFQLSVTATSHRGSAGQQARDAIDAGAEVVFACGGDGTVHDVLQGVVGTTAALAVIPTGSANALCRELGIPLHPLQAARAYRQSAIEMLHLGSCSIAGSTRYFLTMAGAGADGALMYRMLTVDRGRMGRWAYPWHALRLLLRGRFNTFRVRYASVDGRQHEVRAVSALALRIGSLGGIFPGIARGAAVRSGHMRLAVVRPPAGVGLPLWFAMNWMGMDRYNPLLVTEDVRALECDGGDVHVQADGEWIGRLPTLIRMETASVRLLVPGGRVR